MKVALSAVLLAAASSASTENVVRDASDFTSMRPREVEAFQEVSHKCQRDVSYYCDATPLDFPVMIPSQYDDEKDPFTDLHRMLDSFASFSFASPFDTSLLAMPDGSMVSLSFEAAPVMFLVYEEGKDLFPNTPEQHEEAAADHVLSRIAVNTEPEDLETVADQVRQHAQKLLESPEEATGTQIRMARRLEAVTPESLMEQRRNFMPFGSSRRNRCFQQVYEQRLVSSACGTAVQRLEYIRAAQHLESVQRYEEQQFVLKHLIFLYIFVLATMVVIYLRRSSDAKKNRRLKIRILQAVYSKPALKAAIEKEMGESIGHAPPLRWRALMRFGLHGSEFRSWSKVARRMWLAFVVVATFLLSFAPLLFLPLCVGVAAALFWFSVSSDPPTPVCACCCCGCSTEDAKYGTLTKEQACCTCCQGTGVCSPSCASCCGDKPSDGGCCGSCCCCTGSCCCSSSKGVTEGSGCCEGCCCCSSSGHGMVKGCCDGCCCCSGKNGRVKGCCEGCCCCACSSAATKACPCCGGAGEACCCSAATEMEGKKELKFMISPHASVYEGIPVQIV